MALLDRDKFLDVLIAFMAAAASPALQYAGTIDAGHKKDLWREQADETFSNDPYSVGRIYDGALPAFLPVDQVSVQFMTVGTDRAAAIARAQAMLATLRDATTGRLLHMTPIGTSPDRFRIQGITLVSGPAPVGVDDRNRHQVVFNTDIKAVYLG